MAAIVPIFVPHAGCPCRCVFCNQRAIAGQTERMTPEKAERILAQALAVLPEGSAPQAAFYGGSFTAIPVREQEALLAVTDRYLDKGLLSAVRLSTRPDAIDVETLERLKAHGVRTIELGAQSMDDAVLQRAKRGHTAADTVRAARLIQQADIFLILQVMAGLPGDTRETARRTAEQAAALRPDGVRIYPVAVLPETELYALWRAGDYRPLDVETAAVWCADMLDVFEQARIPVIRVGLNPTEELNSTVAAGAYHPAMGELAYGELWYRRLKQQLETGAQGDFRVPARELSRAIGHKRRNLLRLRREFPQKSITIKSLPQ
ncbi:MAG: radical SAM protein [Eubacteriales bacterium]|nr:radical SAM protein [Eubacteriales bacterium]